MAMSLRLRLTLMIAAIFTLVFLGGAALAVRGARNAVAQHVAATTAQSRWLIEAALQDAGQMPGLLQWLLSRLANEAEARQVEVFVAGPGSSPAPRGSRSRNYAAPGWFVSLVAPDAAALDASVHVPATSDTRIVIRADPGAEIEEAWGEVRVLLVSIAVFAFAASVLVFLGIGRGLRPLARILSGLDAIGQGDYRARLPRPDLPELALIVDRVNRIAAALERSREQARQYAGRAIAIREEERRHLARELHDELGQTGSAIKALAVSIAQRGLPADPAIAEQARTIAHAADAMLVTVRDLMRRLRPIVLDELGLATALEQLADDWNERNADAFCALRLSHLSVSLTEAIEIGCYRIVQEALTNASRHAAAQRVDITLAISAGRLRLAIRDDGCGFEPATTARGLGLTGMQERVTALGGTFDLRTARGSGVAIDIDLPLPVS